MPDKDKGKDIKGVYQETPSAIGVGEFENRMIKNFEPEDSKNKKKKK